MILSTGSFDESVDVIAYTDVPDPDIITPLIELPNDWIADFKVNKFGWHLNAGGSKSLTSLPSSAALIAPLLSKQSNNDSGIIGDNAFKY